jgi:hypothetical protein
VPESERNFEKPKILRHAFKINSSEPICCLHFDDTKCWLVFSFSFSIVNMLHAKNSFIVNVVSISGRALSTDVLSMTCIRPWHGACGQLNSLHSLWQTDGLWMSMVRALVNPTAYIFTCSASSYACRLNSRLFEIVASKTLLNLPFQQPSCKDF